MKHWVVSWVLVLCLAPTAWGKSVSPPPLSLDVSTESLSMTNDVATAEAQARDYPEDPEAHFLLAVAYSRTPYLEKALASLKQAKKLLKKTPGGYQNFSQMIQEYEALLRQRPEAPLVLYRLAFAYYLRGYGLEKQYIRDTGETPQVWYDQAEGTLRRLLAVDPKDIHARNYLGYFLIEQDESKNLPEAVRLWEESLLVNPNNPGAYLLLGEAWLKRGDLAKALRYAAQGIQARGETPPAQRRSP